MFEVIVLSIGKNVVFFYIFLLLYGRVCIYVEGNYLSYGLEVIRCN